MLGSRADQNPGHPVSATTDLGTRPLVNGLIEQHLAG
jgi:hypothetical protein